MNSVLLLSSLILISLTHPSYATSAAPQLDDVSTRPELPLKPLISPNERKKLTLFPKNPIKFVVTERYKKINNEYPILNTKPKLMPKVNIKPTEKQTRENYDVEKSTRSPVMKLRVYTTTTPSTESPIQNRQRKRMKSSKYLFSTTNSNGLKLHKNNIINDNKKGSNTTNENINEQTKEILINKNFIKDDPINKDINSIRNKRSNKNILFIPGLNKKYWIVQSATKSYEDIDAEEFIFIGAPKKARVVSNKKPKTRKLTTKKVKPPQPIDFLQEAETLTDMPPGSY